ncbi:NADH-quinone oxidoreductase subunit NuoH [Pontibacter sp. BT310]|uniref:NADH-quinone oxidoreductase subunit H n=1 Tax=Pontibacter populi TaxID=890055 RepID=A0ABS6XGW9_9BACT|nr:MULTISPECIES: NADH-quinone oxidoreductase subunit NuoH [Pontibacter]MBJ6119512.1 NADH-quinone oxidoreductase subunit NuoH [Pontibacter sp. BT310]MBR0571940.1 NADH-quinone oxidoreductase subunit NuoH [Microvirga sp. STS03]MBW3366366.1 NADH-quinone oxidoreductase subunit NuoH [Pontibacter populi]
MESVDLIYKGIFILVIFGITLLIATYSTYFERKIAAFIQDRVGPNRAGPFGLLQPLADAGKLFFKEEFIPAKANKALFIIGPGIAMLVATMSSAVIPFGDMLIVGGREIWLQAIDVNIGVLYVFGIVSLGVYGLMIGGWASNNKFSLLGAIRAASQNISYELAMGLSLIAVLMMTGSLSLREIAEQQQGFNWNIWYQPLGFIIFLVCAFAETNRTPFDLPESEAELIGGYHTEYGSMKLGMYLFAEYINIFVVSAVMSTLYFGAYNFPFMENLRSAISDPVLANNVVTLVGVAVMFAKIFAFIFFFMWVRWTLPRFRYDQLMKLGWQILIPLAILNMVLTGGAILLKDSLF